MKTKQLLTILALLAGTSVFATSWRVNYLATPSPGAAVGGSFNGIEVYQTVQAAINIAGPNDTIYVEASPNTYPLFVIDKPLTIFGEGFYNQFNPQVSGSGLETKTGPFTIEAAGAGTKISGIHFETTTPCQVKANNVTIENCLFSDNSLTVVSENIQDITIRQCIFLDPDNNFNTGTGATQASNISVTNCVFNGKITLQASQVLSKFNNNIIANTITTGTLLNLHASEFKNNILKNAQATYVINDGSTEGISHNIIAANMTNFPTANNNIVLTLAQQNANLFVNPSPNSPDAAYALQAAYTQGNLGSDGTQRGIFGGSTPYILSGVGDIPLIYQMSSNGVATPNSGLNITISTRTSN